MDSYLCFQLAFLLHLVSYIFFLYQWPSSSLCTVFDSISSNIGEVLLINPSANVFVFGEFNVHYKNWLTYSGGTDRPSERSKDLTQMVNFSTWTPVRDSHSPALLDLFLYSDAIKCSTMAFPSLWNSDLLLSDCPLMFRQIHNRMPGFIPYPIFWVIDGFEWFWIASLHKNIQLMLEFLKAAFVVLHFSYYALLTFLMMLSVILLSVLMILSATPRYFLGIPFSWS